MSVIITQQDLQRLESLVLPRWSQMLVWGQRVTEQQAKDIIFRTDDFLTSISRYGGGNNHRWKDWARSVLGYSHLIEADDYALNARVQELLRQRIGFVDTQYVHNTWASSSYIFGPYGWCHPDGRIWYADNVGKYPGAREVFEDWQALARAFPYLDLTVTLMSGEQCEDGITPVVSFRVRDGEVALLTDPAMPGDTDRVEPARNFETLGAQILNLSREQGLSDDWIGEYSVHTCGWLTHVLAEARQELDAIH